MSQLIWPAALILLSAVVGLIRIFRGPTDADRMLAAQLLGTGGVAVLLILALAMQRPALLDVALAYSLLAATAAVIFVRQKWAEDHDMEGEADDVD